MILLSTGLTLVTHQASGQSATLSGLVTDSLENLPLPGAHVRLATPHDSTLRETILGEKGNFLFRQLPAGDVVLTVEFLGFATFNKQIRLIENQDYAAGTIRMAPRPTELGAIEVVGKPVPVQIKGRSEEHTSELQSLMRISYAVFCLKKKKTNMIQSNKPQATRTNTQSTLWQNEARK